MLLYYSIMIIANIASALLFYKDMNISEMSIIPLILIALMIFQGNLFKKEKAENGFRTAYGSDFTADEENALFASASVCIFATVPLMIPFVLFFPPFVKTLSILLYITSLISGPLLYRIKNKENLNNRINSEKREREEQEKKEELGNRQL